MAGFIAKAAGRRFYRLAAHDPIGIAEGATAVDATTQRLQFAFRLRLIEGMKRGHH